LYAQSLKGPFRTFDKTYHTSESFLPMTEGEADDESDDETTSTTLTFNKRTEAFLRRHYPDAIGMSERIRMAIFDARQQREEKGEAVYIEDEDS